MALEISSGKKYIVFSETVNQITKKTNRMKGRKEGGRKGEREGRREGGVKKGVGEGGRKAGRKGRKKERIVFLPMSTHLFDREDPNDLDFSEMLVP